MKLAIFAAAVVAAAPPPASDVMNAVEACSASQAAAGAFSGVVFLQIGAAPPLLRAFGLADRGSGRAIRTDTLFDLGSATKMFTGVAIGQLVGAGKLRFGDTVSRYLPDAPPAIGRITLAQLLSHTGGTGNYLRPENRSRIAAARTARDLMPLVVEEGVRAEPGGDWAYSNSGFVILGAVIEQVSGRSYVDYVRDNILRRAGMKDTVLTAPPASAARRLPREGAVTDDGTWASPAGGGYSSATDLARFATALRDGVLVPPAIRDQLWGAHAAVGPMGSYGFGFGVENGVVGHNGGAAGVNTETWWTVGPGWTFVVLSNFDVPAATIVSQAGRLMLSGRATPDRACADVAERAGRQPPPGARVLVRP